jgi:hypothetical protein
MHWLRQLHQHSPRYTALAVWLAIAVLPVSIALALDTRLYQGIPVWIKPLKFLLSFVLYLLTLAWATRHASAAVTSRPWWRWHERAVVVAVLAEVVWIGGAAALGTGSHFNVTSLPTGVLYGVMGFGAVLLTSATATLAFAIARDRTPALSPALRAGWVWGLGLTLPLTLLTAGTLSAQPNHWVGGTLSDAAGLWLMGWSRDGGDLRVPHFFATHAMQCVPALAWCIARWRGPAAVGWVRAAAGLYTAFVLFTFAQALRGMPFAPWLAAA